MAAEDDGPRKLGIALTWKLLVTEASLDRAEDRGNEDMGNGIHGPGERQGRGGTGMDVVFKSLLAPGARGVVEYQGQPPKQRRYAIEGIPISSLLAASNDKAGPSFRGATGGAPVLPAELHQYAGQSSSLAMLRVTEVMGPSILQVLAQGA